MTMARGVCTAIILGLHSVPVTPWTIGMIQRVPTAVKGGRRSIHWNSDGISNCFGIIPAQGYQRNQEDFSRTHLHMTMVSENVEETLRVDDNHALLQVEACAGLSNEEFSMLVSVVEETYSELVGLMDIACDTSKVRNEARPCLLDRNLIGATGRVLSLRTNLDDEIAECLRLSISERIDSLIYGSGDFLQPVLVSIRTAEDDSVAEVGAVPIIENEVEQYGLRTPIYSHEDASDSAGRTTCIPSLGIEIDGAETQILESGEVFWDTSSILVFDDLITDELRGRLLNVVKGKNADNWNDIKNGPDPNRWVRGGLQDIPDLNDNSDSQQENEDIMSCWGLPSDAIEELCFKDHESIQEFESILTNLFPRFLISRLPEAVYGDSVSPLTANAPIAGEENLYDYHIDGDPMQTPPSPWTDVFGRYPNRSPGKPRFLSCLLYLNDEWDGEKWGAPTKFYDPPTGDSYEVLPRPGRCVIMDQDVGHTVVPPKSAAGKRPRYSLVWKLVFHPTAENQTMTDLSPSPGTWPAPVLFGSAATKRST